MSKSNPLTSASVKSIMSRRILIPSSARRVAVLVDSDGTLVDALDKSGQPIPSRNGDVLQKMIYNLRAVSDIAMSNSRNRSYFINGMKAEKLGGTVKGEIKGKAGDYTADEYFSAYLNATQVSFGLLLTDGTHRLLNKGLGNGVEIVANVQVIETENGKTLTIDPSTISMSAPETFKPAAFDISMFDAEIAADSAKTAADALAGKKGAKKA